MLTNEKNDALIHIQQSIECKSNKNGANDKWEGGMVGIAVSIVSVAAIVIVGVLVCMDVSLHFSF